MTKRIIGCIALAAMSLTASAQNWVDVGLKGGYGITHLFNQDVMNNPDYTPLFTYNGSYGGKFGFNIGEYHEITFDAMFGKFGQDYSYSIEVEPKNRVAYEGSFSFKTQEYILMYRSNNEGRYFEIGPSYTLVSGATSYYPHLTIQDDNPDGRIKPYPSMVMGFGGYILGTNYFGITFGFRFSYALTDIATNNGIQADFPTYLGTFEEYKQTHPLYFGMSMEANFDLAYLAKANCGKRKKLLFFGGN